MAEKRDYYEVLELDRNASSDDIRGAYRRLAKKYHPDVNKDPEAEGRFKEINEAYAVLSNEEHKASYDRFGHRGLEGIPFNFNVGFGEIFEEFFGFGMGRRQRTRAPRRGANLRYDLTLTFEEAVFGIEKEIDFTRQESCPSCQGSGTEPGTTPVRCQTCNGSGEVRQVRQTFLGSMVSVSTCPTCGGQGETISTPCRNCGGRGRVRNKVEREIPIPAGVDDGTQIRVAREGEPGLNGGPPGDLYIAIRVKPHRYFRRRGDDILLDLAINVAQATLGADITVPTIDGDETITIPAATQPGKVLRMKGNGAVRLKRKGRGDQLLIISIDIPRSLTSEQRTLIEELAETLGTEVHPQERSLLDLLKDFFGGPID